jgi:hypothetical protein
VTLSATERKRLAAILGMLGSDHAGERAAAALQAEAFRRRHRLTWTELLAIQPEPPLPDPPPSGPPPPPEPWAVPPVSATDWRGIGSTIAVYGYVLLAFCVLFGAGYLVR